MADATKTRDQHKSNMPGNRAKYTGAMEEENTDSREQTEKNPAKERNDGGRGQNRGPGHTDRPTPGQDEETV